MKLSTIVDPKFTWEFVDNTPWVKLYHHHDLHEASIKELMSLIDEDFLRQGQRAKALKGIRKHPDGFVVGNIARWLIDSAEKSSNGIDYTCSMRFDDWDQVVEDRNLKATDAANMLMWVGNVSLHCTCPSFIYWGYQWILTVLDSAIYDEPRRPIERNPGERGVICKHLNRVLKASPFYRGDLAREIANARR
ncbi:MAG: hypothetical protein WC284_18465 [Candidimonas sp.]